MRGGVGGQGDRGGQGGKDEEPGSVSMQGFLSKDQGGAGVAASTRYHLWGITGPLNVAAMVAQTVDLFQGIGAGQMLYAIPQYFERPTRITCLAIRTAGTIGTAGDPRARIGVWGDGVLGGSSAVAGSPYPANRLGQSGSLEMLPGGVGADRLLESHSLSIVVPGRSYAWAGVVFNADAVTNKHTVPGLRRNSLFPIHGWTLDATSPTTIAQDALTFSVGYRHAITFVTTDALPDPYPQTAPALLNGGAAVDTVNIPAILYRREPA